MRAHITVITLAVDDIQRALGFYRDGLGFPSRGILGSEQDHTAVGILELDGGLMLSLYQRSDLARDANVPAGGRSPAEFTLGHNVGSKAEVDALMEQARKAGAAITDEAHDRLWGGYSGYFQDLDGHLWEVAWDPHP
jgi:uncharacterized protein